MMQAPPLPPPAPSSWTIHSLIPQKKRSYTLQRDYKVLEREQRVTTLLGSDAFRSELENILRGQLEGTGQPRRTRPQSPSALSPGRSADIAQKSIRHPASTAMMVGGGGGEPVIPINDLRGSDASKYTVAERDQRCKLASVYRLVHMFGWSQLIYNHITACAPGGDNTYLINAFGLLYPEVTASNLVRVNLQGDVLDPGSTSLGINRDGYALHSAIHEARTDIKCIIHLHTNAGIAISSMNCGLLPVSSEAVGLGGVSYHNLESYQAEDDDDESHDEWRVKIASDLGPSNKVLLLRNHGLVALGSSIEEAFHIAHKLVKACEIQVALMSAGLGNILQHPHSTQGVWSSVGVSCMGGVGGACGGSIGSNPRKWKVGDLEFEALMRMLDNKGYNTGYRYKGLGLLEPSTGSPTINRKDPMQCTGRISEKPKDQWDFLDEKKLAPQEPLTKAKYLRQSSAAKTDESRSLGSDTTSDTSSEKPQHASHEGYQSLTPLQHVQLTAKQVAHSTGEAVEKLSSQGTPHAKHSDRSVSLTPLQHAQQLTAKEVTKMTGDLEVAERLGPQLNGVDQTHPLSSVRSGAARYQHSTPKRHVAPDSHKLEAVEHSSSLSPLQRTKLTAKKVAKSTSKSLQKLSSSEYVPYSVPLGFEQTNGRSHHSQSKVSTLSAEKESGRIGRSDRQKHVLALTNGRSHVDDEDLSSKVSESDISDSNSSASVSSETRMLAQIADSAQQDHDHLSDGVSSFEKVKRTAEMVADSTGVAVQKLSSSLSESI